MSSALPSFRPSDYFDGSYISDPVPFSIFDGKEIRVVLDGMSDDSRDLAEYENAVGNILGLSKDDRERITPEVFKNYTDVRTACESLGWDCPVISEKDIWQHIYPSEIIVSRRARRDKDLYVQVHCECDWEIEHGLQLVFRRGLQLTRVSDIDGHDTESDACDVPDSEDILLSKFKE